MRVRLIKRFGRKVKVREAKDVARCSFADAPVSKSLFLEFINLLAASDEHTRRCAKKLPFPRARKVITICYLIAKLN